MRALTGTSTVWRCKRSRAVVRRGSAQPVCRYPPQFGDGQQPFGEPVAHRHGRLPARRGNALNSGHPFDAQRRLSGQPPSGCPEPASGSPNPRPEPPASRLHRRPARARGRRLSANWQVSKTMPIRVALVLECIPTLEVRMSQPLSQPHRYSLTGSRGGAPCPRSRRMSSSVAASAASSPRWGRCAPGSR